MGRTNSRNSSKNNAKQPAKQFETAKTVSGAAEAFVKAVKEEKKVYHEHANSFTNNFKTLQNHTSYIYQLSKLRDGRLASCSKDYSLNIYKSKYFGLQLKIKEHSNSIIEQRQNA